MNTSNYEAPQYAITSSLHLTSLPFDPNIPNAPAFKSDVSMGPQEMQASGANLL
jgi:hypothetical protein